MFFLSLAVIVLLGGIFLFLAITVVGVVVVVIVVLIFLYLIVSRLLGGTKSLSSTTITAQVADESGLGSGSGAVTTRKLETLKSRLSADHFSAAADSAAATVSAQLDKMNLFKKFNTFDKVVGVDRIYGRYTRIVGPLRGDEKIVQHETGIKKVDEPSLEKTATTDNVDNAEEELAKVARIVEVPEEEDDASLSSYD